jgi:hypothetical protein
MARRATALKEVGPSESVFVQPINLAVVRIRIRGTAPLVINKFPKKARDQMMAAMATPKSQKKAKSERAPRDYEQDMIQAQHRSAEGWPGFPCSGFRAASVAACRAAGVVMTHAKQAFFVLPDGYDVDAGTPLVRVIAKRDPERTELPVRNDNGGADIRVRPMWREWEAVVTVQFDADMISTESVINLLHRAGVQVGIGEGRPGSKMSVGQGWGTFEILGVVDPSDKTAPVNGKVTPLVSRRTK